MILADTSVWIDHLRSGDARLAALLLENRIVGHPHVVAEIALGSLRERSRTLDLLDSLHALPLASPAEVRALIEARALHGRGLGYVGASLLAACLLAPGARLWTRDRRLAMAAGDLDLAAPADL